MLRNALIAISLLSTVYAASTVVLEYTCFWYVLLDMTGNTVQIFCNTTDVFDPEQGRCVRPEDGNWPCADLEDCSGREDKRYVDLNPGKPEYQCKSYFTCHGGVFFGHNYCPGNTVFNEEQQYCDWIQNVKPPCGTNIDVSG